MTNTSPASEANLGNGVVISVDYAAENAIAKAIEDGRFNKYVDIDVADIPLGGTGEGKHEVFELHLNRTIYSRDLPDELDRNKVAFADPLTALGYAAKLPDRQRKYPLAILFTNNSGQLCYLILDEFDGGRSLSVDRESSSGNWGEGVRFLVVRKSV
jgi:hypothetical protein